ncbi:MAG: glycosyltransferase N-terminal domain-containing protein [Verrucomicrobiota bacterium]
MPRSVVYLIYNLLLPVVLVIGFPAFIIKGLRRGGLARHFRQRFGLFRPETLAPFSDRRPIWIHAVSVGEAFIALKLIDALLDRNPAEAIVLSTTTTTGYAVAESRAEGRFTVIHNPVDLPWIVGSVIQKLNPSRLVLIESEVWPNLVRQLKKKSIPVMLCNARLSPRSERRYRSAKAWIAPVFAQIDKTTVPYEIDVERWSSIGIQRENIDVTGSIKFDHAAAPTQIEKQIDDLKNWLLENECPMEAPILLGGSTHPGEESLLAKIWLQLRQDHPHLQLLLVPRHAERAGSIVTELEALGIDLIVKKGDFSTTNLDSRPRAFLANTTGELRAWYHIASVVFVGKTFHGEGGQNPVEPILTGRPVVVGPNTENFADVVSELLDAQGITQVETEEALASTLSDWLAKPELGLEQATRGAAIMQRHFGAASRNAAIVESLLSNE